MQQRNEQLVERHAQHSRFIGRFAGVGGVVDRILAQRDAVHREHRELGAFVVVAGVVAVRPFERMLPAAGVCGIGVDMAFEHDFGVCRDGERYAQRGRHLGARTAQQAGKLVFGQAVGHGRHGAQDGRQVGANGDGHRVRLAGVQAAVLGKIERPPRCASQRMMSWLRPSTCWR